MKADASKTRDGFAAFIHNIPAALFEMSNYCFENRCWISI